MVGSTNLCYGWRSNSRKPATPSVLQDRVTGFHLEPYSIVTRTTSGHLVQACEPSECALDDLAEDLDQGPEDVVGARNNHAGFLPSVSSEGDQKFLDILVLDQGLGHAEPDRPSRGRARAHLGTHENPHADAPKPANSNVPDEVQPKPKRAWTLRKRERDDLRRRTTTLAIPWELYEQARQAYGNAQIRGHDLDALVTLRPRIVVDLDPMEREELFKRQIHAMRTAFAANENLPEPAYVWSRESKRIGTERKPEGVGEHLHMILATGGRLDLVERYLRKHLRGEHEVDVTAASAFTKRLRNGQVGDASTYVLKAVEPRYWKTFPETPHRASGPIFGQRVGWSKNLLAEQPIGRKPRPRRTG
jgi:hypothetical protein